MQYVVDPELFLTLSSLVAIVQTTQHLELYHVAWWCLPSREAFELTVINATATDVLLHFIRVAKISFSKPSLVSESEELLDFSVKDTTSQA